jgi:AraC-like DNA-binding protein
MSTLLAFETPVTDTTVDDTGQTSILHSSFETDRLDPTRLESAHSLPLRQFRLLAASPRRLVHQGCDDGTQQVHLLQIDAAVCLELDLPPGSRYRLTSGLPEGLYVDHEPAVLNTVLESALGGPLRIVSRRGFSLELVSRRMPDGAAARRPGTTVDASAEQVVRQLLDIARSLWITPAATPRRRTPASHVLEVVEQVLAEQPYGVLHPSDFATPARISVRSLERALQRAYAMGPKRWITNTRMNTAHRHLRDPGPDDRTVAQIARRCGFLHAGRFSKEYRALFGDYPHEVLSPPISSGTVPPRP